MTLLVLSSCQVHAILHLKILSKSWPFPLPNFLLAPFLLNFIMLMLRNLSSLVHVTGAVWLKHLFPQPEHRKLPVTSLEAVEAAPVQAEKRQKSSQSGKQSWEEERWMKTDPSKVSIPAKSLIVPEQTPGTGLPSAERSLFWCFSLWDWLMGQLWERHGPRTPGT